MSKSSEIIAYLKSISDPSLIIKREKQFGIKNSNGFGITHKDLNQIAKEIGKNKELAIDLYNSKIYEARLLASKIFPPKELTLQLAASWCKDFNTWEMCDSFCQIYAKSHIADQFVKSHYNKKPEFEKRAAFATLSSFCSADKKSSNTLFSDYFPLIEEVLDDNRLYVKKSISWALRSIGKRNIDLKDEVIEFCENLKSRSTHSKAIKWIIQDVLNELEGVKLRMSDYPRSVYRKQEIP